MKMSAVGLSAIYEITSFWKGRKDGKLNLSLRNSSIALKIIIVKKRKSIFNYT
tara:strand:- start:316 stop:474 length:159 start_codon:yes stop_codon:yes gene_type:complete